MPLPRSIIYEKEEDKPSVWERLIIFSTDIVREYKSPMSDKGWTNLIAKELEIDFKMANRLFLQLVENKVLSFVRIYHGLNIYINDRTSEFKRYMFNGDIKL